MAFTMGDGLFSNSPTLHLICMGGCWRSCDLWHQTTWFTCLWHDQVGYPHQPLLTSGTSSTTPPPRKIYPPYVTPGQNTSSMTTWRQPRAQDSAKSLGSKVTHLNPNISGVSFYQTMIQNVTMPQKSHKDWAGPKDGTHPCNNFTVSLHHKNSILHKKDYEIPLLWPIHNVHLIPPVI